MPAPWPARRPRPRRCPGHTSPRRPRRRRHTPSLAGSYRFERDGWIFVHLQGPPATLGFQHGYLLADEIADLLRVAPPFIAHESKRDWPFYRDAAERMLWPRIEAEYREELQGIVAGLAARGKQADLWDIVALNAIEELPSYYVQVKRKPFITIRIG